MGLSEVFTVVFSGVLVLATVANALFAYRLWRVNGELRDLQRFLDKQSRNPDLRVFIQNGWNYEPDSIISDNGPGTLETTATFDKWEGVLHLWNTGSSTILVTSWKLEAHPHSNKPRMWSPKGAFLVKAPITIPAHSVVQVRADISGYHCRTLLFNYSTVSTENRMIEVPLVSRSGFRHPGGSTR